MVSAGISTRRAYLSVLVAVPEASQIQDKAFHWAGTCNVTFEGNPKERGHKLVLLPFGLSVEESQPVASSQSIGGTRPYAVS